MANRVLFPRKFPLENKKNEIENSQGKPLQKGSTFHSFLCMKFPNPYNQLF